jgi:protein-tyrosine phosphatase
MNEINTANPLAGPYRTGSYLISDLGPDNFRSAMSLKDHPYRASGSHQLGLADFVRVLSEEVVSPFKPETIFLVDLREETHGFFNGAPVSWYSDNDFGNVGQPKDLIVSDERWKLASYESHWTDLFELEDDASDDLQQERVLPISKTPVMVSSARTEEDVAVILSTVLAPVVVRYVRIPVTDHCAPSDSALAELFNLEQRLGGNEWLHFHCHGGDGRTSTFLALFDMLRWKRTGDRLPALEEFAARQCQLFDYSLDPSGAGCGKQTTGWKLPLAQARWQALEDFLARLKAKREGNRA